MINNEAQINFSNLRKDFPYTFTLHRWQTGLRYKRVHVVFDASYKFKHAIRMFRLCLPIRPLIKELYSQPMKFKRAENVRITFKKLDKGEIEIIKLEAV